MQTAFDQALSELHATAPGEINPWYYPSVSEYATLLEMNGFEVRFITLFDRPTPLADGEAGMRNWITMFGSDYFAKLSAETRESFLRRVEELLHPELFRDGQWMADYRRLRLVAAR
jgi:trans-aconitate 2-methyltransferase